MEPNLKYILENEIGGNKREALNAAVTALYFADNSDYQTALWEVICALLEGEVPEYAGNEFIRELVYCLNPDWNK